MAPDSRKVLVLRSEQMILSPDRGTRWLLLVYTCLYLHVTALI
jgi:hypothetical protein